MNRFRHRHYDFVRVQFRFDRSRRRIDSIRDVRKTLVVAVQCRLAVRGAVFVGLRDAAIAGSQMVFDEKFARKTGACDR